MISAELRASKMRPSLERRRASPLDTAPLVLICSMVAARSARFTQTPSSKVVRPSASAAEWPRSRSKAGLTSTMRSSDTRAIMIASGLARKMVAKRSCERSASACAFLRSVTSRVMPSKAGLPPSAPGSNTACVSSQRRVPFSPTISNSSIPLPPAITRRCSSPKRCWCSGTR